MVVNEWLRYQMA